MKRTSYLLALVLLAGIAPGEPRPATAQEPDTGRVTIEGIVRDAVTGRGVAYAIVSVAGTRVSTLATADGHFRLDLDPGSWELQVRKIGYRMASRPLTVPRDGDVPALELELNPIAVRLPGVTVRGAEDPARSIIRRAIARKNDLLERIHDYRYDAYVKFVVRDLGADPDSSASIVLLTETATTAYWEQPDRYQETILARRQSGNLDPERNLVSVGQIVNFNRNRIDLEKYSVVSPTADDALDHYDYFVADTVRYGDRRVFRLAVEPRSQTDPLFVGMVDVADSTWDVLAVDVRANAAVRFEFFDDLRYRQRMARVAEDAWMPEEIRFTGEVHFGIPIPGFPEDLTFEHAARLRDFRLDQGEPPATLGEYLIVVDEGADDLDSADWAVRRPAPLSEAERAAWSRIDSVADRPPSLGRRLLRGTATLLTLGTNPDFFHFNRVEGAYVGAGVTLRELSPDLSLRVRTGYALEREAWQHRYGASYRLSERRRLWVGGSYRNEIVSRPSMVSGGTNQTFDALFAKSDPLDYYRERGVSLFLSGRLADFVTGSLRYDHLEQFSEPERTGYSFFDRDEPLRPNPPVADGRLRAFTAGLTYDSRPLLKRKGRDFRLGRFTYTRVSASVQWASPSVLDGDLDYVRFLVTLRRRHRTFNLGLTTVDLIAGGSARDLPPQRYFTVDFGDPLFFQEAGFQTLDDHNFSGNWAAMLTIDHDFDQLFRRSGIPLVRSVPFTFSIHGGVFWTDFLRQSPQAIVPPVLTADSPYVEAGFGVGNLTPMLAPLNLKVWLTWQLTDYDTDRLNFGFGVPGF